MNSLKLTLVGPDETGSAVEVVREAEALADLRTNSPEKWGTNGNVWGL